MPKIKNIKLYFLFAVILASAILVPYILHKKIPFAAQQIPDT